MTDQQQQGIPIPPGIICVTSYGHIQLETVKSLLDMALYASKIGVSNIRFDFILGSLVDKARNEAVLQLLRSEAQWLWFIDGDMAFEPNIIEHMLMCAFNTHKWADIVGGYANLKGDPYLPTIDTGTGTWEPHDANQGVVEVIRTGAANVLVKRHVYEQMEYPWYGIRPAPRMIDMLSEVDGFFRQKYDGKNPLSEVPEWNKGLEIAAQHAGQERQALMQQGKMAAPGFGLSTVGEDSNFCDKAKARGFRIIVNTNAIMTHLERRQVGPKQHHEAMKKQLRQQREACGIYD